MKFGIPLVLTQQEIDSINWTNANSKEIESNKPSTTAFKVIKDNADGSPFIRYTYKKDDITQAWFKVEVSLPKFLYGSNVFELAKSDMPKFYKELRKYLATALRLPVSKIPIVELWTVQKVHVCKNFNVGNHKQSYLKTTSNCSIEKYNRRLFFAKGESKIETVEWNANGKKIKVYDKEAEIQQQKNCPKKNQHIQAAKGILRFEVELSDSDIRRINEDRLATKILTFENASEMLQKSLELCGLSEGVKYTSHRHLIDEINKLSNLSVRSKSALIAFVTEWIVNGKEGCQQKYAQSTYWKKVKQMKELLGVRKILVGEINLPPLMIDTTKKAATVLTEQMAAND